MKLRRLTDKIGIFIWVIGIFVVLLTIVDIVFKPFSQFCIIPIQVLGVAIQLLLIIVGCRAFDKRWKFSSKVSDAVLTCYFVQNAMPTLKAIEDYKEELRKKKDE